MSLTPGQPFGPYEVVCSLGAGGMGEVYRARDTKLDRDVALKILPELFATDPERVLRFTREAKTLAALNHPNIAAIYGIEALALVMELVEGEDLSVHIARGPIALAEALAIARQIVEALEAAHDAGIIHRDLKPANIKVREDGTVKVLDFGLARTMDDRSGMQDVAHSPTLTARATALGMIIGTAAYMSPEQARGRAVDKRTDVWAFGCVLYEMLSGTKAFAGDDATEIISAVVKSEPDWTALPVAVPPHIRTIVTRCLVKDRKARIPDLSVVRYMLDGVIPAAGASDTVLPAPRSGTRVWQAAAFVAGAALVGLAGSFAGWGFAPEATAPVSRLSIELAAPPDAIAISNDGTRILARTGPSLELRSMSDFEVVALKVADVDAIGHAVLSPDATSIAFVAARTLKRMPASGGAAVDLAQLPGEPEGCHWTGAHIYCALGADGVVRVAASGGALEQVITLAAGEHAATPQLLPGGDALLFTLAPGTQRPNWQRSSIVVQSPSSGQRDVVTALGTDPRYLATGHVAYVVGGVWYAVRFDLEDRRAIGDPVAMVTGIRRSTTGGLLRPKASVDVSATGTLIYLAGSTASSLEKQIVFTDRSGKDRMLALAPARYESPRISPDGRLLALSTDSPQEAAVFVYDLSEKHAIRRLTFAGRSRLPLWSPDNTRIAFQSDREGDTAIWSQAADGSGDAKRLTKADTGVVHVPESWSRDGLYVSFSVVREAGIELWLRSMSDGTSVRFGDVRSNAPLNSSFSPDGKWIAYTERGRAGNTPTAVFVQPVPATGARYQVSTDNTAGHHPFWSPDGKELFHWSIGGTFLVSNSMVVSGSVTVGRPVRVPGLHVSNTSALGPLNYDMTPNGREFVLTRAVSAAAASPEGPAERGSIRVVLNWFEELNRLGTVKP